MSLSTLNHRLDSNTLSDELQAQVYAQAKLDKMAPMAYLKEFYPRIGQQVEMHWGTHTLQIFLNRLLLEDNHAGSMPQQLGRVLIQLFNDHAEQFKIDTQLPPVSK